MTFFVLGWIDFCPLLLPLVGSFFHPQITLSEAFLYVLAGYGFLFLARTSFSDIPFYPLAAFPIFLILAGVTHSVEWVCFVLVFAIYGVEYCLRVTFWPVRPFFLAMFPGTATYTRDLVKSMTPREKKAVFFIGAGAVLYGQYKRFNPDQKMTTVEKYEFPDGTKAEIITTSSLGPAGLPVTVAFLPFRL